MIFNIAKKVVVQLLQATGDPKLVELSKWVDSAEDRAIELILSIITEGLRTNGHIDSDTAAAALQVRTAGSVAPLDTVQAALSSTSPYLAVYRQVALTVAALASWREAIYLHGFIHTADCASLWVFPNCTSPVLLPTENHAGEKSLSLDCESLKVYLLPPLSPEDLLGRNQGIGNNITAWRSGMQFDQLDQVWSVTEDSVDVHAVVRTVKKLRTGGTREDLSREFRTLVLTNRELGLDALIGSLHRAVEARDAALTSLRSKTSR